MLSEVFDIKKFLNLRNPLFQFAVFLLIFAGISTFDLYIGTSDVHEKIIFGRNILLVAGFGSIFYYISRFVLGFTITNPLNIFVTSLLIYLLIHPSNPWWFFILAFVGVFVGKYFFKNNNLPIFNPTAFGLFFTLYLTKFLAALKLAPDSLLISWWGADMRQQFLEKTPIFNILAAAALLLLFMYFARSFRKLNYAMTFFLTYLFCYFGYNLLISHQPAATIQLVSYAFFDSTVFLALVMLSEPKTSPVLPTQHIVVGILSGAVLFSCVTVLTNFIAEPFITTVLIANLFTLFCKKFKFLSS